MSETASERNYLEEERIELLLEEADGILEQKEEIRTAFDKTIGSDLIFNNFDHFFRYLSGCLYGKVDDESTEKVAEAILNTANRFTTNIADELRDDGEKGEELAEFLTQLEVEYGIQLDRRVNRMYKGQDWWSNIKTEPGYRSGNPFFRHEIVKDYNERVVITTDAQNTLVLARHLVNEVNEARTQLGEDILDHLNPSLVEDLDELVNELAQAVEDYPESPTEEPNSDEE